MEHDARQVDEGLTWTTKRAEQPRGCAACNCRSVRSKRELARPKGDDERQAGWDQFSADV
jgi:hypothetical protein